MLKIFYLFLFTAFFINLNSLVNAKENFFHKAKKLYDNKNYEDSKFLLQRNIVFNPKDYLSYLYLAKIYKEEENKMELEKNLDTTLLLNPKNEEALYMLIELHIEESNFSKVKELNETFLLICSKLCDKKLIIAEKIKDLEYKNESQQ